jgi:GT2 family glycosyltransferase
MTAPVAVAIVSFESAAELPGCLAAVSRLDPAPAELLVVDCASSDGSATAAEAHLPSGIDARVEPLASNLGFSGGTNRAVALSSSPWVLTLNPDARPAPDYLARLLELARDPRAGRVGAVTGRLSRPGDPARLDACGMRLARAWRHLDRGSGELDRGQYDRPERVFGATGAASLWCREALVDVAIAGAAFDESFHSFREDAELCFRLRERGWEIVYQPAARAIHRRRVTPSGRRRLPPEINRRSLQNRYLLRVGHQTWANLWRTLPWTVVRDVGALIWVLGAERSSLAAYSWLWRHRGEIVARRRELRSRVSAPAAAVERWFGRQGEPL